VRSRTAGGRCIARLPFKAGPPIAIGDSLQIAATLYAWTERRLQSRPEISRPYHDSVANFVMPESSIYDLTVLILHFAILRMRLLLLPIVREMKVVRSLIGYRFRNAYIVPVHMIWKIVRNFCYHRLSSAVLLLEQCRFVSIVYDRVISQRSAQVKRDACIVRTLPIVSLVSYRHRCYPL